MAYASVGDLETRWRQLTPDEVTVAQALLDDATVRIDAECPPADEMTETELSARLIVAVGMVKRAMMHPGGAGVQSTQQTAGPFSKSLTYSNPTGDLYVTKAERRLLGCGQQKAFTVPMGRP